MLCTALAAGFAGVWALQEKIDRESGGDTSESQDLLLRSPNVVKALSLEYAPLAGALYWTRAVQYYGYKHKVHDRNLDELWPLLDTTTTLDPKLIVAYRFGATFLSDAPPRGAGQPDLAVKLLERGIQENPGYWRFYQDLGNVYYFDKKDYLKASEAFAQGSQLAGAPPFMQIMAAKIAADGQSLETSYALWLNIYQTTTDKEIRKNAEEHLRIVAAQLEIREVNRVAGEYEKRTGHKAASMEELVQAGLLRGAPVDAYGFALQLSGGAAEINPKSPLRGEMERLQQ